MITNELNEIAILIFSNLILLYFQDNFETEFHMEITEICSHTNFKKNFVKVTFSSKKLLKG